MIPDAGAGESGAARHIRIAFFTDTLGDVNGVSRFLNDIADQAEATGRSLAIFTSTRLPVRDLCSIINVHPRAAARLPGYHDLEVVLPPARRLFRAACRFGPDVVHVSTPGPVGLVGRFTALRLGVPLAGVYHTDFPAYVDRLLADDGLVHVSRAAMRRFYRPFRTVLARSRAYDTPLAAIGVDDHRRAILRPGFRTDRFHPRFRADRVWRSAGVPEGGLKVLYVGRVSVEKNLPRLTEIWKRVCSCAPHAHLVVVGDGPYRAEMESQLEGTRAHFLGFRHGEELSRLYASGDVFVFPSVTDTLGQVVLESQASGLPVLVSDVGGPKEVVSHGRTGYVLPHDRIDLWAQTLVRLLENTALRRELGAAAHTHVQQFSLHRSLEEFWSLHERLARTERAITNLENALDRSAMPPISRATHPDRTSQRLDSLAV